MKTTLGIAVLGIGFLAAQGCATEASEAEDVSSAKSAVTAGAVYTLKGVHSQRCIDIAWGSANNGANAQIYDCWGGTPQQFKFEDMGSGYYRLRNVSSSKCLDVPGSSTSDGANIQQYSCHSGWNQQFRVESHGSAVVLVARHSNKAIDVAGWGTANGTNVQQWTNQANNTQKFTLTQVGGSSSSSSTTGGGSTGGGGESSLPDACFANQRIDMTCAALAVAMAEEMGRLDPLKDLQIQWVNGAERVVISGTGWGRCSNGCENVQAILDLQDNSVNNVIDQNVFNANSFRSNLVSQYWDQQNYENGHQHLMPGAYSLSLAGTSPAYCGTDYEFQVNWQCSNCNTNTAAIENQMKFFRPNNTVIDFQASGSTVTIDPTGQLNDGGSGSGSGSCVDACMKFTRNASNLIGDCCSCEGVNGNFVQGNNNRTVLCETN